MPQLSEHNLIWIDLEMTGLDPEHDQIIEIATIITDSKLEILAEGPVVAINQPDSILNSMDEWNTSHHTSSGLVDRVRSSDVTASQAEQTTIEFLSQWVPAGRSPMSGNSICQDRRFMARHMPKLEAYFHYRNLDVSTIKILAQRWAPQIAESFTKESRHLALSDIRDSISELVHYRNSFFKDFR